MKVNDKCGAKTVRAHTGGRPFNVKSWTIDMHSHATETPSLLKDVISSAADMHVIAQHRDHQCIFEHSGMFMDDITMGHACRGRTKAMAHV